MLYLQPESQRKEFAEKLESLLHRAYHLQEEFGSTFPADSMLLDLGEQGLGAARLVHRIQDIYREEYTPMYLPGA